MASITYLLVIVAAHSNLLMEDYQYKPTGKLFRNLVRLSALIALMGVSFRGSAQKDYLLSNSNSGSSVSVAFTNTSFVAEDSASPPPIPKFQPPSQEAILQKIIDTWREKIAFHHSSDLFLHVDKSIYSKNENILFTGYLLSNHDTENNNILYAVLTDLSTKKVVASDRFIMLRGISSGFLHLEDSLAGGEYLLSAYTNVTLEGKPQTPFQQEISIQSGEEGPVIARKVEKGEPATISYYPEGGELVDKHRSRIGIEIKDQNGLGVSSDGSLLEDGHVIADIQTNADGLGVTQCTVHRGRSYTVQLKRQASEASLVGDFPAISPEGYTLSIPHAVVKNFLTVRVQAPQAGSSCSIMIYTDEDTLYASNLSSPEEISEMTLPVTGWPRGLARVTLFDEEGTPVAERAIFLSGGRLNVQMVADSSSYHTRSKVQLHIKVTDENGNGVKSLFSFASVLSSSISNYHVPDIGNRDSSLELGLMTKFWMHYYWTKMASEDLAESPKLSSLETGYVLYAGKKPKKPIQLLLMGPSVYYPFETDSTGHFTIPYEMLVARPGVDMVVSVMEKGNQERYSLILHDNDSTDTHLIRLWHKMSPPPIAGSTSEDLKDDSSFNALKHLNEIIVKVQEKDQYGAGESIPHCKDYLCPGWSGGGSNGDSKLQDIDCLDSPDEFSQDTAWYHRLQTHIRPKPLKGRTYYYLGEPITYDRCIHPEADVLPPYMKKLSLIHLTKEFYAPDYSKVSAIDSQIHTTVQWTPLIATNNYGEATITYLTDDLESRFTNLIQGISEKGPLTGKLFFSVRN